MRKIFIIVFVFVSILSNAQTYYVTPRGNDANDGSDTISTKAWKTWQKAFLMAQAGDTVYFRGGVYDASWEYKEEYGTPDVVGWVYDFDVNTIRKNPSKYFDLIERLDDDEFVLKQEYMEMREYLKKLQAKQKPTGNSLFDLF